MDFTIKAVNISNGQLSAICRELLSSQRNFKEVVGKEFSYDQLERIITGSYDRMIAYCKIRESY